MSTSYKLGKGHQSPPTVLKKRDLPGLAAYIRSDKCKNIVLMLGAGVSTSAGIPDFRSPGTGLYSNLQRLNLPHPEAVFEINFFRRNPVPFYTLAHELFPGKFRPTPTHSFIRLLHDKGLLHTCFTQNIDTLERRAGVPDDKIIEAHGSFATQRCINCSRAYDDAKMKEHILAKTIAHCESCNGYVKPDIVFFGEALPPAFIRSIPNMSKADLLIVMGTSLTVHPFASLADRNPKDCPRVLINLERVGDFGAEPDDLILLGSCDDIVKELCRELGWYDDLMNLWAETSAEGTVGPDGKKVKALKAGKKGQKEKKEYVPETWSENDEDAEGEDDTEDAPPSKLQRQDEAEQAPDVPDVLKDLEENLANLAVDEEEKKVQDKKRDKRAPISAAPENDTPVEEKGKKVQEKKRNKRAPISAAPENDAPPPAAPPKLTDKL